MFHQKSWFALAPVGAKPEMLTFAFPTEFATANDILTFVPSTDVAVISLPIKLNASAVFVSKTPSS